MKLKIFSIRDSKAEAFLQPIFATTTGVAMRQLGAAVNQDGHDLNKFTDDYALFDLGEFDDQSGLIAPNPTPTVVCQAHDLKENK